MKRKKKIAIGLLIKIFTRERFHEVLICTQFSSQNSVKFGEKKKKTNMRRT